MSILKLWGFVFTSVAGVLLHFLYDWTGESVLAAPFSAVNESTWEHMKLLFYPIFIFSFIEYKFIGNEYDNIWCATLFGAIAGLVAIPVLYYVSTGAFGIRADWFNVAIFFIAAGIAYYVEAQILKNDIDFCTQTVGFAALCVIALMFVVMTFVTPKLPLFKDPITGNYGI